MRVFPNIRLLDRRSPTRYLVFAHAAIFHTLALSPILFSKEIDKQLGFAWSRQAILLTLALCLLSLAMLIVRNPNQCAVILLFRFTGCMVLLYPMRADCLPAMLFGFLLITESYTYLDTALDSIMAGLFTLAFAGFSLPHKRLDPNVDSPGLINAIILGVCLLLVCYLFYLLKNERQKRIQLKNDRDVLRNNLTQLTLTNLEYQKFAAHIEEEAADSERKRITRDIHDTVGYTMTNVSMAMEAALRLIPPDDNELRKLILLTKEQARDGLKETRDALYRLRQHEVETIRGLQAVRKLASIFEQITGIHVKQDYSNVNGSFGDDVDRFLFRFVQEGLVNAFKHAKPTEIDIYFHLTDNILHVHIADNGRGCTALKEGIGMQGIRERLSRLGGELNLHCDSSGFALLANIPIESNNGEENHGSNGNTNRR